MKFILLNVAWDVLLFAATNAAINLAAIVDKNGACARFAADIVGIGEAQGNDIA